MAYLLFFSLLIAGILLRFIVRIRDETVLKLTIGYKTIAIIVNSCFLLLLIPGAQQPPVVNILSPAVSVSALLSYLAAGYLGAYALTGPIKSECVPGAVRVSTFNAILQGTAMLTGLTFVFEGVSKIARYQENAQFFHRSGYPIWFMFFIMSAEILGGFGILFHGRLKTGQQAAAGLMVIMTGAVYTHVHTKDPFSDSYAAIAQFVNLTLLLALYYSEKQFKSKQYPDQVNPNSVTEIPKV